MSAVNRGVSEKPADPAPQPRSGVALGPGRGPRRWAAPSRWTVLRTGVSLTLLIFLATRVDGGQLAAAAWSIDLPLAALAFGCTVPAWLLNTYKWQRLLLAQGQRASFLHLLGLNYAGIFYSVVLPGQMGGEVVKGVWLARAGAGGGQAAVSILVDRLTGVASLGLLGLAGLLLAPAVAMAPLMLWVPAIACLLALGPLVLLAAGAPGRFLALPIAAPLLPLLRRFLLPLRDAVASYRGARGTLAAALALALGFQGLVTLSNYIAARAVGVDIPPLALLWIVALVSLVHLVPVSFAGLGLREGAYVILLQQYGIALAPALTLSLAVFAIIVLQGLVGGLAELLSPRLKVGSAAPAPGRGPS